MPEIAGQAAEERAEERAGFAPALPFALVSSGETLVGKGCLGLVAEGDEPLGARVRAHLAASAAFRGPAPDIVVGALPYEPGAPAHLFQPAELSRSAGRACFAAAFPPPALVRPPPARPPHMCIAAEPPLAAYRAAVAEALVRMQASEGAPMGEVLRKIVLSRSLRLSSDRPIDASTLLRALARDAGVTAFCVPLAGAPQTPGRALVGATPELLVARQGTVVTSHPLAGSARRRREASADRAAAQALLASDKDRREHGEVVTAILDQLAPHCVDLGTPVGIGLTATASMWHLGTRITGRLRRTELSAIDLAVLLHPTPAVCGTPRALAARAIAELEGYDRGFYSGAVGWCDGAGDGTWHVALRCAEVAGHEARLYAGAGIVPGSDPVSEGEETSAKFAAMLQALGIDEDGRPLTEDGA
ncbi:isochorismate synthase [Angulomicrobium tetraedrale]|uniref:isochorismate synthase n=1 Tax=Ancylobacter tetraedralis TaxID=217068 RepID=A0A839Z7F2_9HYPH|nr:isochorismate synthase [Ancylobacter tetraedralis]MBB3771021.1 isochorismate synthase [Ancylobacter tetraedralis]